MWHVLTGLLILTYGTQALYEGDVCSHNGVLGTCSPLSSCQSVKNDIQNRRRVTNCGFDDNGPIVCCRDFPVQGPPNNLPIATTIPPRPSTTEYVPPTYDYEVVNRQGLGVESTVCPPVPSKLTSPKTGQKAWDKCLEYQEKLIYPCEDGVALVIGASKTRGHYCLHDADHLIIGGQNAEKYEFPHMVLLGYGEDISDLQWLCGGSLISEKFILTAGHCISHRDTGNVSFVYVGGYKRSDTRNLTNIYRVKSIYRHPLYKPPAKYHDITLLELDREVPLSKYIVPACLHVPEDQVDDSKVSATGWGLSDYKGSVSETLQKVILSKFPTSECASKFGVSHHMKEGFDEYTQVCYGDKGESKDTCQGDSGGPIQIKSKKINCMYVVVGVTSFGKACGFIGDPGIYTLVSAYVSWIEPIVWP